MGPIIAPFWADADTTGIGNVFYRSTCEQILLRNASNIINAAFADTSFIPHYLTIVTWFQVGYYDNKADKVSLELCIVSIYILDLVLMLLLHTE